MRPSIRLIGMNRSFAIATAAALLAVGCSAAPKSSTDSPVPTNKPTGPSSGGFGSSRLVFFDDCPALLTYLRTESLKRVSAWGLDGGGPIYYSRDAVSPSAEGAPVADSASTVGGAVPSKSGEGSGDPTYSGTNTQEVGVDEGDVVETDGTHVFVASQDGVRIVDVADAAVTAKLDLPDGSHQLLLDGTRLLVATQPYNGIDTVVSLYDVSDVTAPVLLHRSHLEGRLIATRAIDGTARLVLTSSLSTRLAFVNPNQFGLDEDRALQRNKDIITQSTVDDWMPRSFDVSADGTFGDISTTLDCAAVAAPSEFAGLGVSWIASIDLHGSGTAIGSAGIVSNSDTVYASTNNIYMATVAWDWYQPTQDASPRSNTPPPTLIHEFSLGADGSAAYVASGEVPGQLLNQFSMSEYQGDLRVATTTNDWTGQALPSSAVRVLRPEGNELVQIGEVDGLGKTEQIYAVRFFGTQGYVVTFRQTDPLYVIDLSDPTSPVVRGELKIPGYSAYLHPVGDGLLLGVGQDAGADGRVQGTQLSLFDVSDPANPQRLSTLPIGGTSDAEWDHHAFLYWPEDGTIVLPVSPGWNNCGPAVDCLAGTVTNPNGGVVVAQLQGTTLVGRGSISSEPQLQSQSNPGCWNPLQRSLVIDTELVTVGVGEMQFTDRDSLVTRDSVQWGNPEQYGCYWYG